jgi:hypothetical protein
VLLKIVYLLTGRVLGLAVLMFLGDRAKDAKPQPSIPAPSFDASGTGMVRGHDAGG